MNILAIETCLAACSAAIRGDGALRAHRHEVINRGHAEALVPMIEAVRNEAGLAYADLDLIAVTVGPGTFTGIRTGIAAARAFSLAAGVPVIGFSSLHALAAGAAAAGAVGPSEAVLAAIDARRGEVYVQSFGPGLSPKGPPEICSLSEAVAGAPAGPGAIVGTGGTLLIEGLSAAGSTLTLTASPDQPEARIVAQLAEDQGLPTGAAAAPVRPLYLRAPDARLP